MIISIIAAMSVDRVIGLNNAMPWNIPEELQHFKKITMGKPMIMGRKTFDAIGRRLLPGRRTIVLSNDANLLGDGFVVAHSIQEALESAADCPEVMVVGGAGVYAAFLPIAHRMYLSYVSGNYAGDAFFPEFDKNVWQVVDEHEHSRFSTKILQRLANKT